MEYVILAEQQRGADARAQARAEAQEAAAEARAAALAAAAEARAEAARVRQQVQQDVQQQIREQMEHRVHVGDGQGFGVGQGPRGEPVIMVPPPFREHDIPPHVLEVITIFIVAAVICIVGLPIARAIGRWIDRRGLPSPVSTELAAQMNRIEQAVDTMAVEVERISEAQRFQAKLLSDQVRA